MDGDGFFCDECGEWWNDEDVDEGVMYTPDGDTICEDCWEVVDSVAELVF